MAVVIFAKFGHIEPGKTASHPFLSFAFKVEIHLCEKPD